MYIVLFLFLVCSLDDVLYELKKNLKAKVYRIEITRDNVLEDLLKESRRLMFDPLNRNLTPSGLNFYQ